MRCEAEQCTDTCSALFCVGSFPLCTKHWPFKLVSRVVDQYVQTEAGADKRPAQVLMLTQHGGTNLQVIMWYIRAAHRWKAIHYVWHLKCCCNLQGGDDESRTAISSGFYLGDEQNHQRDVDREDDGQGGEGEGGVLLGGQDHGDRGCDHTQHLRRTQTNMLRSGFTEKDVVQ